MHSADSNQSHPDEKRVTANSTASYHRHPHPAENGFATATYNTFDEISLNSTPTPISTLHSGGKAGKRPSISGERRKSRRLSTHSNPFGNSGNYSIETSQPQNGNGHTNGSNGGNGTAGSGRKFPARFKLAPKIKPGKLGASNKMDQKRLVAVVVLFVVNLLNYMDRYTVAGVLPDIQHYYSINDTWGGLLQTVFIILFLICAPVAGFLGDRYNRKWIMVGGLSAWVGAVFASSFVPPEHFWLFISLRGIVGIGEASYSTIAPTIIADLFAGKLRSKVLMLFYFAIPMGAGLGYVAGSFVAAELSDWRWGIRVTPALGIISILTLWLFVDEPKRGHADQQASSAALASAINGGEENRSESGGDTSSQLPAIPEHPHFVNDMDVRSITNEASYLEDLRYLIKIPTYLYSIVGYTAVVFVTGTFSWWAPTAIDHALAMQAGLNHTTDLEKNDQEKVALVFGGITVLSGFIGVGAGTLWSQAWKEGRCLFARCKTRRADPIISAIGSFAAVPLLFTGFHLIAVSLTPAWIAIFFAIAALCLNWAINVDMLMAIIVPDKRSTANSWLIMISHLFGDASGPYVVGAMSDWLRGGDQSPAAHFYSLMHAFYVPNSVLVVSGVAFLWCARTLGDDMLNFKIEMERLQRQQPGPPVAVVVATNRVVPINEAQLLSPQAEGLANEAFNHDGLVD